LSTSRRSSRIGTAWIAFEDPSGWLRCSRIRTDRQSGEGLASSSPSRSALIDLNRDLRRNPTIRDSRAVARHASLAACAAPAGSGGMLPSGSLPRSTRRWCWRWKWAPVASYPNRICEARNSIGKGRPDKGLTGQFPWFSRVRSTIYAAGCPRAHTNGGTGTAARFTAPVC
jgi:hypothetical protein